jgi:hypothetical protein
MLKSTSLHLSVLSTSGLPRSYPVHDRPRKVRWSAEEDQSLEAAVSQHGTSNWGIIAASLPGRTGKQCRERWTNQLSPSLTRETWTPQEDTLLIHQQKMYGNAWSKIAQSLPGRSGNAIKNRWCYLMEVRVRMDSSGDAQPRETPAISNPDTEGEKGRRRVPEAPPPPPIPEREPVKVTFAETPAPPEPEVRKEKQFGFPWFDWSDPSLDPFAD